MNSLLFLSNMTHFLHATKALADSPLAPAGSQVPDAFLADPLPVSGFNTCTFGPSTREVADLSVDAEARGGVESQCHLVTSSNAVVLLLQEKKGPEDATSGLPPFACCPCLEGHVPDPVLSVMSQVEHGPVWGSLFGPSLEEVGSTLPPSMGCPNGLSHVEASGSQVLGLGLVPFPNGLPELSFEFWNVAPIKICLKLAGSDVCLRSVCSDPPSVSHSHHVNKVFENLKWDLRCFEKEGEPSDTEDNCVEADVRRLFWQPIEQHGPVSSDKAWEIAHKEFTSSVANTIVVSRDCIVFSSESELNVTILQLMKKQKKQQQQQKTKKKKLCDILTHVFSKNLIMLHVRMAKELGMQIHGKEDQFLKLYKDFFCWNS